MLIAQLLIGIEFKLLLLISAYTGTTTKPPTYHEGLTALGRSSSKEMSPRITSPSGVFISHLSADGHEREDRGNLPGYIFH